MCFFLRVPATSTLTVSPSIRPSPRRNSLGGIEISKRCRVSGPAHTLPQNKHLWTSSFCCVFHPEHGKMEIDSVLKKKNRMDHLIAMELSACVEMLIKDTEHYLGVETDNIYYTM